MAFCGNCGTQLNDGVAFCPKCGQAIGAAPNVQQQTGSAEQAAPTYQQYQQPQQQPIKPDSNMILAILSTLFCCLPMGVAAIISASKVDKLYYAGQYNAAEEASNRAKKYSMIGAILGIIVSLVYFTICFIGGFIDGYSATIE